LADAVAAGRDGRGENTGLKQESSDSLASTGCRRGCRLLKLSRRLGEQFLTFFAFAAAAPRSATSKRLYRRAHERRATEE
jgi:hypothetical protein